MIRVIQADSWKWMHNNKTVVHIDHIITDYEYGTDFWLSICKNICYGNIITFCASEDHPFAPTERAYWIKTPSTKNTKAMKKLSRFVEKIFIYRQGETFNTPPDLHWSNYVNWYDDRVVEGEGHQWRKPISLCERLVRIYTNSGDTVLDPFCGHGSILEACLNLGRNAIGIDKDPECVEYCKLKFGLED